MRELTEMPAKPLRQRRRWFSYSVRTLLLLTTIVAAALGFWVVPAERQRRAVAAIRDVGGEVGYDFEFDSEFHWIYYYEPSSPSGLCKVLGIDYCADVVLVRMGSTTSNAELERLSVFASLQSLELSGRHVSGVGLRHLFDAGLVHLSALTNLLELDLSWTRITDAGLAHLTALANLQDLDLGGTQITDAGLAHLSALKNLQRLDVRYTEFTDGGCDKLQKALPNCSILRGGK